MHRCRLFRPNISRDPFWALRGEHEIEGFQRQCEREALDVEPAGHGLGSGCVVCCGKLARCIVICLDGSCLWVVQHMAVL